MVSTDTFLTILYVMEDDFCKSKLPEISTSEPTNIASEFLFETMPLFSIRTLVRKGS